MIKPFIFWSQKVLPLVYDDSLSYYEVLEKAVYKLNEVIDNENNLNMSFDEFTKYIEEYISSISVKDEVEREMLVLIQDGYFSRLINEEIFGELNEKITKLEKSITYVTPEMFNAKGDGNTNDLVAFNALIAYANENNVPISFEPGKNYKVNGDMLPIKTSLNGNGSTLTITEGCVINITDENIPDVSIPFSYISKYKIADARLYGKSFLLRTGFNMGERSSQPGVYDRYSIGIQLDADGNILQGEIPFKNMPSGEYTASVIHNKYAYPITIENVVVNVDGIFRPDIFVVNRDNVTLKNVKVTGNSVQNGVTIMISGCNIVIENITGINPNTQQTWGYLLAINYGDNIAIKNVNIDNNRNNAWASFQSEYAGNLTLENCCMSRFDIHRCSWGNVTLKNCNMKRAQIPGGYVNYNFDNCKFTGQEDAYCVYSRFDYAIPIMGSVVFNQCKFNDEKYAFRYRSAQRETADDYNEYFNLGLSVIYNSCGRIYKPLYLYNDVLDGDIVYLEVNNCELIAPDTNEGYSRVDRAGCIVKYKNCKFANSSNLIVSTTGISKVTVEECDFNAVSQYTQNCENVIVEKCYNGTLYCRAFTRIKNIMCDINIATGNTQSEIITYSRSVYRQMSNTDATIEKWQEILNGAEKITVVAGYSGAGNTQRIAVCDIPRSLILNSGRIFTVGCINDDNGETLSFAIRLSNTQLPTLTIKVGSVAATENYVSYVIYTN